MAYRLAGTMLEACTCNAICPCWVGQDPDGGICEGAIARHFEVFSVIRGAPADVGRAPKLKASGPALGLRLDLQGQSAVPGAFRFAA